MLELKDLTTVELKSIEYISEDLNKLFDSYGIFKFNHPFVLKLLIELKLIYPILSINTKLKDLENTFRYKNEFQVQFGNSTNKELALDQIKKKIILKYPVISNQDIEYYERTIEDVYKRQPLISVILIS